ncbi:MAG: CDP-diacylglycerol--serine O-phosphatidyltransferase [Pseudomonadota bacterium]
MKFRRRKKNKEGVRRGIYLLPNLCTTGSLFFGFFSIVKSWGGDFKAAAWAILLAGVFDLLDGRLARLTRSQSEFGVEYDSLVDLCSFGLAPGILIYTWSLYGMHKFGWLASFLFFACGALRLARYNVQHDNLEKMDFEGLPIPAAAYVLATFVIFHEYFNVFPPVGNWWVLSMVVILALLMVTTIRYRSMKLLDLRSRNSFFALVLMVVVIFVIAIRPEVTLFLLVCGYVLTGIIEELVTLKKSRGFFRWIMGKDTDEDEATIL